MKTEIFEYNGYTATVILPENPNGEWVWKTEFLYAFDQAEQALLDKGYTRVYYKISDKFGSKNAVELMYKFHQALLEKYPFLTEKANLFGFSRGGLYAFNYAISYPQMVKKIYLDAPVLNLKSWPPKNSPDQKLFFNEYGLTEQSFEDFKDSPTDNLEKFYKNGIPILMVAGDSDLVVPFCDNGQLLVDYYNKQGKIVPLYLKKDCGHHPHSLEDVSPILDFICK